MSNVLLLLLWCAIALALRLVWLTSQPPWTDECATIVFSLGNSFLGVPLDRVISTSALMQPFVPDPEAGVSDVVRHLMSESTHPPVYFILSHWWLQLFPTTSEGWVSVWGARSLSALFGVLAVPAIYGCSWLAFRSRSMAQFAAALMAVSPFGIFLAREARHYTLAILLVIASLCCFIVAIRAIRSDERFPVWLAIAWIFVNAIGISTHYFFALNLGAQFLVLLAFWLAELVPSGGRTPFAPTSISWKSIYLAILGTLVSGLVWVPIWKTIADSRLTQWVSDGDVAGIGAIGRLFVWIATMLFVLPTDNSILPISVVIVCGIILGVAFIGTIAIAYRGWQYNKRDRQHQVILHSLGGYIVATLALFLTVTYGFGNDITLAPRFCFVCFPTIILLFSACLASAWKRDRHKIIAIFGLSFLGAITVLFNSSYMQHERADALAKYIHDSSNGPVLIATTHKHHGQTGRMMALAWQLDRLDETRSPQFLLAHKPLPGEAETNPGQLLLEVVDNTPRPIYIWTVNFHAPVFVNDRPGCDKDKRERPDLSSYRYRGYYCEPE